MNKLGNMKAVAIYKKFEIPLFFSHFRSCSVPFRLDPLLSLPSRLDGRRKNGGGEKAISCSFQASAPHHRRINKTHRLLKRRVLPLLPHDPFSGGLPLSLEATNEMGATLPVRKTDQGWVDFELKLPELISEAKPSKVFR